MVFSDILVRSNARRNLHVSNPSKRGTPRNLEGEKRRPAAANSRLHGVIFATGPNSTINHKQTVAACYGSF